MCRKNKSILSCDGTRIDVFVLEEAKCRIAVMIVFWYLNDAINMNFFFLHGMSSSCQTNPLNRVHTYFIRTTVPTRFLRINKRSRRASHVLMHAFFSSGTEIRYNNIIVIGIGTYVYGRRVGRPKDNSVW